MMKWLPFELHTHTFHSDGKHSLLEMARSARELGLHGVALTDHNTMTGLDGKDQVEAETGVTVVPGLEWTTFFGHMVTLGIREYVDWRNLSPFHIHKGIKAVHDQGGVAGVAHPFRVGSPMCTGCFWEFEVADWNDIDYIEVWSGTFPSVQRNNARAFAMWTELLNRGHRIAATSGRDWHLCEAVSEPVCATFLQLPEEDASVQTVLEAVRGGRMIVSMGPLPLLEIVSPASRQSYTVGDCIDKETCAGTFEYRIGVDFSARAGYWDMPEQTLEVRLIGSSGELAAVKVPPGGDTACGSVGLDHVRWLRAQLYGTIAGVRTMIGFTNPVYIC